MTKFLSLVSISFLALLFLSALAVVGQKDPFVLTNLWSIASQEQQITTVTWENITEGQIRKNSDKQNFGLIMLQVQASAHALREHPEAQLIQDCANKNGFYQVWKSLYDKHTYYGVCELPDGRFGLAAFADSLKNNKTAFIPNDGSLNSVLKYLSKIATRYLKGIPE